ncbi:hypothetical protein [Citricoccus nitrophenolicus]|uniref:hypothetical protein n=1 Tax=Citricoccus nitrophenolicus TaxID=863575 RepID=UPI0031EA9F3F
MNRIEKTYRCPRDGRAVARIEVEDKRRWLVILPNRDGHVQSLTAEMAEAATAWKGDWPLIARGLGDEFYARALAKLENVDPSKTLPERREAIPSEQQILADRLGKDQLPTHGACPKCHHPYAFTVQFLPNGFHDVLMS